MDAAEMGDLLPFQQQLLAKMDGSRTAAEILESDERTLRTIFALWLTGFVELLDEPALVPNEAPRKAPPRPNDDARKSRTAPVPKETGSLAQEEGGSGALEAEQWFRKGERRLAAKRYDEAVEAFGMSSHLDPGEDARRLAGEEGVRLPREADSCLGYFADLEIV